MATCKLPVWTMGAMFWMMFSDVMLPWYFWRSLAMTWHVPNTHNDEKSMHVSLNLEVEMGPYTVKLGAVPGRWTRDMQMLKDNKRVTSNLDSMQAYDTHQSIAKYTVFGILGCHVLLAGMRLVSEITLATEYEYCAADKKTDH